MISLMLFSLASTTVIQFVDQYGNVWRRMFVVRLLLVFVVRLLLVNFLIDWNRWLTPIFVIDLRYIFILNEKHLLNA